MDLGRVERARIPSMVAKGSTPTQKLYLHIHVICTESLISNISDEFCSATMHFLRLKKKALTGDHLRFLILNVLAY